MNRNIDHLLFHCGSLRDKENLVIICDSTTKDLGEAFKNQAIKITSQVDLLEIPLVNKHGAEPPSFAKDQMCQADLIISLCKYSLAHSKARVEAAMHGARFLSLPFYSWDLLNDPSVGVDYKSQAPLVKRISEALTVGSRVRVTSRLGTDISMEISGRRGNFCPGFVSQKGELGSPPDIEANISPIEDKSNGTIIVDGSITCSELGLLDESVVLDVQNGEIKKFESKNCRYVDILNGIFDASRPKRRILAECGIGLNPLAVISGTMLTDEGSLGGVHFGFGSNYTVGGKNEVDFHLDFVVKAATLRIDQEFILKDGELSI